MASLDQDGLRDDQWARIWPLIPGGIEGKRDARADNRRFVNALLWVARSGARWKDLPPAFGAFQTVKRRHCRWLERGLIDRLFEPLGQDADLEWLMLDSTVIRADQQVAGAPKKKGARKPKAWAVREAAFRPRGLSGISCVVHELNIAAGRS